mmetsp:Transcript_13674/g.36843  ORF Transcript_13674/g.36843 Transcript_13674/m.36843 type:complete len:95 (+) Transcript_13674:2193-2477(+)
MDVPWLRWAADIRIDCWGTDACCKMLCVGNTLARGCSSSYMLVSQMLPAATLRSIASAKWVVLHFRNRYATQCRNGLLVARLLIQKHDQGQPRI